MRVSQILNSKKSPGVITIDPDQRVQEAVALLADKGIGAAVVSSDQKTILGILSERDIVRELRRRGPACMEDTVSKVMTRDPVTCTGDEDSDEVFRKMTEGRFRHMPVVRDGAMVGLISIGDVVAARVSELAMEKHALQGMIMGH